MGDMAITVLTPDDNERPRVAIPHISFSQLSTYLRCSLQYYYAYVLRLRQRPSLPMSIGSGGHSALEYNGRHKIKTGLDLDMPDLMDIASTFIDYETQELEPQDLNGASIGTAKDGALAAIYVYRHRDAEAITPAGVEIEFNLDLNVENRDPIRIVNGKIDLITTDGSVEDYKFVSRARSQGDVDLSPQLTLYGKVVKTLTGRYPTQTGYRMFLPGGTRTPPDVRALYRDASLMTPEKQERRFTRLATQFEQVERDIRAGRYIPSDDSKTCAWCGYRDRCQASLVDDFEARTIRGDQ